MQRAFHCALIAGFVFIVTALFAAQGTEAENCARLIMKAAAEAKGKPYLLETEKFIIIGNDCIAAGFDKRTLEMAAVVDVTSEGNLLAVGTGHSGR